MHRKSIILAVAAVVIGVVVASAAGGDKPPLPPPAQAQLLAKQPAQVGKPVVRPATPAEVNQAAQQFRQEPGYTDVEGTPPVNPSSPSGPSGSLLASADDAEGSGGGPCWYTDGLWSQWGAWPLEMRVTEHRYWCASWVGGPLSYRVSHVTLSGTWCGGSNAYAFKTGGGVGYSWVVVQSGAHFSCVYSINYDQWQRWASNSWGSVSLVAHS